MSNIFNEPISVIINNRHSVRNYENIEITKEVKEKIQNYLDEINKSEGIFGGKIKVNLVKSDDSEKDMKLGTYGVIRGAKYYLVTSCENDKKTNLIDLGFLFEKVILYCTSLGLGTVWLGGTFNKSNFARSINLKDNEILPIVSPVGVESDKKSLIGRVFGRTSSKRKDFEEVCFNNNFETPLKKEDAGQYSEVLEMVRLAPSAVNMQPWRIIKENNNYHIYNEGKRELNSVDVGIGLCHFYLTAKEKELNGEFKVLNNKEHDKFNYVISWITS